ncbi:xanthine dehydrogenase family protein molybdopterin-binding subunit [Pseudomarimonas salicorniae]|uniref:Molybdopterin-dependent oxidoreductase n=1 Tax=Pseudomarimonas salicorniae TaxID=2933270 RepID=A0ABT0GHU0_9GAMM|nr:molybdopterin cofactor-binding domain-containing protein [Lysobacter sp. CAU 1642]MCK7594100.1 molybdopterin-dependent oxidoreductase [Lysobacter sp. CAU 1642]
MSTPDRDDFGPSLIRAGTAIAEDARSATSATADSLAAIDRRGFLRVSLLAGGALLCAWQMPGRLGAREAEAGTDGVGLFVRIEADGTTWIGARCPEIGQGVSTSLPMLIAEELDADWSRVRVEQLPLGLVPLPDGSGVTWKYGPQGAGGSTSIPGAWADLRQVGAKARWMLVEAAARRWKVPAATLRTEKGRVLRGDGVSLGYGELAAEAASVVPPETELALKAPTDWRIVGTPQRMVDADAIVTGRATYGIDANLPGALVAVIERCPWLQGELEGFDAEAALKVPGVRQVLAVPGPAPGAPVTANLAPGVAVLADDTWSALKGRRALVVRWKPGPYAEESSAKLDAQAEALLRGEGIRCRDDGDFDAARKAAARVVEATYRVPYVAHAPLEPQNACVHVERDRVTVLAPMQQPAGASRLVHELTGIDRMNIEVRMTRVGGGFGRRLSNDFIAEAVLLSKASGKPIKLLWTREDEQRHDFFRPFGHHQLIATLDAEGAVTGYAHRLASASKYSRRPGVPAEDMWKPEIYPDDFPARLLPHVRMEWFAVESGVTRGSWRAPGHTANAFAVQSFLDEVAHAAGRDPLALRLALLGEARALPYAQHGGPNFETGRLAGVLRRVAERIGWGRDPGRRRGLGLAAHFTFGGYAAHAMEVEVDASGSWRIHRCVCAVDVGRAINPLGLEAQMMGGTLDGISTARALESSVAEGRIVETNFDRYPLLASRDAPDVEVEIIRSNADPAGAGEMGIPTAAPALANAIFAASGVRVRRLPIRDQVAEGLRA